MWQDQGCVARLPDTGEQAGAPLSKSPPCTATVASVGLESTFCSKALQVPADRSALHARWLQATQTTGPSSHMRRSAMTSTTCSRLSIGQWDLPGT